MLENIKKDLSIELGKVDFSKEFCEKKRICYVNGHPEKAVTPYVKMYSAAKLMGCDKLEKLYFRVDFDENGCNGAVVYEDYGFVCNQIGYLSKIDTLQNIFECLTQYKCGTYSEYKKQVAENMKIGGYVNLCDIRVAELFGEEPSYIKALIDYRSAYIEAQDEKIKRERIAAQQADAEFVGKKQSKVEAEILEMENAIKLNAVAVCSKVNVYFARYQYSEKTVLMLLMKKYGIAVPLRTQGWISTSLFSFKIDENRQVSCYSYRKSKSKVVQKYLQMLVSAVCSET